MSEETAARPAERARVIAVASGKGGVGKSTVAVNLAVAFALEGKRTGLLDADVHGPSVPRMLGLQERPEFGERRKIVPLERHGVKFMSIGNLVDEENPIIWRGPMVHGAIRQLLNDVDWGEIDVLIADMPPGTGDAPMTMAKLARPGGVVIVSTPQDVALADARKAIGMFRKLKVPMAGIVENMSGFVCPHCGGRSDIFGHGGAGREAERLGIRFLGEIPIDPLLRETSDSGKPVTAADPEGVRAGIFRAMARAVWEETS